MAGAIVAPDQQPCGSMPRHEVNAPDDNGAGWLTSGCGGDSILEQ